MIQLLNELQARGVRLRLKGDNIEFVAPRGAMTPELLRELRAHKSHLIDYLRLTDGSAPDQRVAPSACLLPLQRDGLRTPLFLAHPAGGEALCYRDLAQRLGNDQPTYGLRSPGWTSDPPTTIEEMASIYVQAIRSVQKRGPYRIGGWSLGGLTVFEMARQLEAAGEEVDRMLLLDPAAPPVLHPHEFVSRVLGQLSTAFEYMLGKPLPGLAESVEAADPDAFFETALCSVDGAAGTLATPDVVLRCKRILLTHMEAYKKYETDVRIHVGRTLVLYTEQMRLDHYQRFFRDQIEGPMNMHMLAVPHALLVLEPHAAAVAEFVRGALA